MKSTWEQRPAVFKATAQRRGLFDGLFCFAELQRLARICEQEGEPLQFGVDVNAARYVDGTRETPNGDLATAQAIQHLSDELGCTMQVHAQARQQCAGPLELERHASAASCASLQHPPPPPPPPPRPPPAHCLESSCTSRSASVKSCGAF